MKRAILISCYYPPDGGVGVQRVLKLVENAGLSGWHLTVITRKPQKKRTTWEPVDESLARSEDGNVIRVEMPEASTSGSMVPSPAGEDDPFVSAVVDIVIKEIDRESLDAIILTMPPYGMAPIVTAIRRLSKIPIFVDLRDPWALDGACSYSNKAQWEVNNRWMRDVLSIATGVIANTPEAGKQLQTAIRGLPSDRIAIVNNGVDIMSFQGDMPPRPEAMPAHGVQIVHTGTLHSHAFQRTRGIIGQIRKRRNFRFEKISISGRTVYHLLRAMRRLSKQRPELMTDVCLNLIGVDDSATRKIVDQSGMRDRVRMIGFVSYRESVAWMRHADILFLPLFGLPNGHRSRIIPYKTYEYLASGRPILGALPHGDARDLVEQSGRSCCSEPCDDAGIANALCNMLSFADKFKYDPKDNESFYEQYEWKRQCALFFDFINTRIIKSL